MPTIISCIKNNALHYPKHTAVSDENESISYEELWEKVQAFAEWLTLTGVKNHSRIVIEAVPSVFYPIAVLGIHLSGNISVPIENGISAENAIRIISETDSSLFVCNNKIDGFSCISYSEIAKVVEENCENDHWWEMPKEKSIADILYTTGTTGASKGVMQSHASEFATSDNNRFADDLNEKSVYLISSPLNHASGLRKMYSCFIAASQVVILDGFLDIAKFYNTIDRFGVNVLWLPPSAIRMLLTVSKSELNKYENQIKVIHSGSAPMPEADKEELCVSLPKTRLIFGYGASEAGNACAYDYAAFPGKINCVGKANPHNRIFITDENYNEISSSKENCGFVAISGDNVMDGYFNDPIRTKKVLSGNTLYTNDIGYITDDGFVFVIGRKGDIINFGGLKIAPSEVEGVAMSYSGVADCACFGIPDRVSGMTVKLNIVVGNKNDFDIRSFRAYLKKHLENYKLPKIIECIEKIPKTPNGKIDRKRLK